MIMRLYEMKKKDFKKGQKVFLKAIEDEKIREAYITKVTNDYVYAKGDSMYESCKFNIDNRFRQVVNIGGRKWGLYLNESQITEEELAKKCIAQIREVFKDRYYGEVDLPLDKLKRICEVLVEVE